MSAPAGYREALAALNRAALQKTARGLPAYTRYVNRPLGRRVAALASQLGATPNQVTAVGMTLTFAAVAVLALVPPRPGTGLLVAALLAVGFVLDSADGPLARLRGGGTPDGEWLDHVADAAKHVTLHSAVLISFYRWFDLRPAMLLVPIAFLVVEVVVFFTAMLTESLQRLHGVDRQRAVSAAPAWRAVLLLPVDYGTLLVSFALLGWHAAFVTVYTGLAACTAGYLALLLPKWFRDVRALRDAG